MLVPLALALAASASSFDCTKATTNVEKMICADPELAAADRAVAETYRAAKARSMKGVVADQQRWLAGRNECANRNCVVSHYDDRLFELLPASHLGRGYHSEGGKLTVLPLGSDWYAFAVLRTYVRWFPNPRDNRTTDAWASGVFRLVDGKGERLADVSGWRLTRVRNGWRVECLPDIMSCGGLNATIDGEYR